MGFYRSTGETLSNNSVVMAHEGFLPGTFFCVSGRKEAGIGKWIAPNGDDYSLPGTHSFEVSVGGENNPGVVEISVIGVDNRFPAGQWDGVYSCVIPDETGTERTIYLGIYLVFGTGKTDDTLRIYDCMSCGCNDHTNTDSPPQPVIHSLMASSQGLYPFFTLNCSSSDSAPTEVTWQEDGQIITADILNHSTVQILRNGRSSSYDNLLVIYNSDVNENSGRYSCAIDNAFGSVTQEETLLGKFTYVRLISN